MQLHCIGVLLDHQKTNPYTYIKDKHSLILNLISGLQLARWWLKQGTHKLSISFCLPKSYPWYHFHFFSEEVQGEVLFLLYKISLLQDEYNDCSIANVLIENCKKLLCLSLEALMKTQSDDVRMNCIGLYLSFLLFKLILFRYSSSPPPTYRSFDDLFSYSVSHSPTHIVNKNELST